MILLDYKDRRPIYEQIIEKFQQMILCGVLQPGDAMPSVRSLAMELSINLNTIQRAYQELERSGYIISVKGKGSFVNDTRDTAEIKRREAQTAFVSCVEQALAAGVSESELTELLWEGVRKYSVLNQKLPTSDNPNNLESQARNLQPTERQGE